MKIKKNTPKLWDKNWKEISEKEERYSFEKEKKSILWERIRKRVVDSFGGTFKNLKTIEMGAGRGTYSLLFALEGAEVTILDYSKKAIDASKLFFKRHNAKATFTQMDALDLNKKFLSKFDVSMSFGTAEHFKGEKRIRFIKSHFDVLKKGRISFIVVPNRWNFIYRLWMFLSQIFGRWVFGEEYPFSRRELINIGRILGIKFEVFGAYLFDSQFNFPRRIRRLFGKAPNYNISKIKKQFGTPLDKYLSRTLVAFGKENGMYAQNT